jgi:hypothetical protein
MFAKATPSRFRTYQVAGTSWWLMVAAHGGRHLMVAPEGGMARLGGRARLTRKLAPIRYRSVAESRRDGLLENVAGTGTP